MDEIKKGDKVLHLQHGPGVILGVGLLAGDAILLIQFDRVGQKRLMAKQAQLIRADS